MRIEKWGFLLSYAIYLVFCIIFSLVSKDTAAIDSMIFAITIASTAFSISDLLFTKFDIDKKERETLSGLYQLTNQAKKFYIDKIKVKYGEKDEIMISMLMELFEENEDVIAKFFEGNLSSEEKEYLLNRVKTYSNDELTEFVMRFSEADDPEIKDVFSEYEIEEKSTDEVLNKQEKSEAINYKIASSITVLGLVALLMILTLRINAISYVNNTLTVVAFLSVILNLLLKEYYKANSLKNMEQDKKELLKDLRTYNNS
ncbi:hypothetical protein [Clostridium sp. UBA3887]|uniref:hypothetical protein n=1 Tax=Clostridium sp. UBA3887 TaxID=1946356 RepID=UPI003217A708